MSPPSYRPGFIRDFGWFVMAWDESMTLGLGIGPTGHRLTAAHIRGCRWGFGTLQFTIGYGQGCYAGMVLGEWVDDVPHSVGLGPVQLFTVRAKEQS